MSNDTKIKKLLDSFSVFMVVSSFSKEELYSGVKLHRLKRKLSAGYWKYGISLFRKPFIAHLFVERVKTKTLLEQTVDSGYLKMVKNSENTIAVLTPAGKKAWLEQTKILREISDEAERLSLNHALT